MKYSILILSVLLLTSLINPLSAQVTIGSNTAPNKGAMLDLRENDNVGSNANKGLLFPRVKLTSLSNLYPMMETAPESGTPNSDYDTPEKKATEDAKHQGLVVYNLNESPNCGFGDGLYIWMGDVWEPLKDDPNVYNGGFATDVKALKAFYDANPGNTLGWDFKNGNPTNFAGTMWDKNGCGEQRIIMLSASKKNLTSTVGLNKLSGLQILSIGGNSFQSLDLSGNPNLQVLSCSDSPNLYSLNVTNNKQLTSLAFMNTFLTFIDLSNNVSLTDLTCDNSKLTTLDLTKNVNLSKVTCTNNLLTSILVDKNMSSLTMFKADHNYMTQSAVDALDAVGLCSSLGATGPNKGVSLLPQLGSNPATKNPAGCNK